MNSQTCIHAGSICDGIVNCPEGDDEHLCSINEAQCPSLCSCLHLAIVCFEAYFLNITTGEFPYQVVFITYSAPNFISQFLSQMKLVRILSLKNNKLKSMCSILPSVSSTLLIDFSFNEIEYISRNCFSKGLNLKLIKLNNNQISTFFRATILHLNNLDYLDLSGNNLTTIFNDLSSIYVSLKILVVFKNRLDIRLTSSLKTVGVQLFLTNNYHLCCITPTKIMCTSEVPWYTVCSSLLINGSLRVSYYVVSFVIIITSVLSFIAQKISNKNEFTSSFIIIMYSISFEDFLSGFYLIILWLNDLQYGDEFITRGAKWTSSGNCLAAFFIFLHFNLVSPILLDLLSFSRLMVITDPLTTCFKHNNFVLKVVLGIFLLTTPITGLLILLIFKEKASVPFRLCSPLVYIHRSFSFFSFLALALFGLQIFACIWNILIYTKLWRVIKKKDEEIYSILKQKQISIAPFAQIFVLVSSNILCWFAGNMIYIAGIFMEKYPIEMMMWTTIVVSPINSIVHPVVFVSMVSKR